MSTTPQNLSAIIRGDHSPVYTATASRTGGTAPDLIAAGTVIRLMARRKATTPGALLFTKTIGSGVTVVNATTFRFQLDPADTADITSSGSNVLLELEAEVTEANGDVTTVWRGLLPVIPDLG